MHENRGVGRLNIDSLKEIQSIAVPQPRIFELPEKILQFGTGVLLRGLPDYYIDQANKQGVFNGRIVIVKSTTQNSVDDFKEQNGLYTLCLRGWADGQMISKDIINSAISRVIDSSVNWQAVLEAAANPDMQLVFSNTTEVGIVLDKTDLLVKGRTPVSFPGKLLAFLLERFQVFKGDPAKGMIIIPTELITDNGKTLRNICLQLAAINSLSPAFIQWLEDSNEFCDSLVDRIVAGRMQPGEEVAALEKLGYSDRLMIMSEVYGLWAIQSSKQTTAAALNFNQIDAGVIITPSIEKYRRLKLFLLNAPHTFTCVIAQVLGFQFVNEAMRDKDFEGFIRDLLMDEAVPAVMGGDITRQEAAAFAEQVLDRFKNPYIDHRWSDISKQMTLKMGLRCLPLIMAYYEKFKELPVRMIRGFAAYLLPLKNQQKTADGQLFAQLNGQRMLNITDAKAEILAEHLGRNAVTGAERMLQILKDTRLWPASVIKKLADLEGFDLTFALATAEVLKAMEEDGVKKQIKF